MLGYLFMDIICSEKQTVFREQSSRKSVSFEDKYPSISLPQMEVIVFIILHIFFTMCAVLKIGQYSRIFHSFSWGIFGHMMCLDQSRASENIWWIIVHSITQNTLEAIDNHFKLPSLIWHQSKPKRSSTYWQRYVIRFLWVFLLWGYIWGGRQWWFWHFHHSAQWKVIQFFWAVPILSTKKFKMLNTNTNKK